jgi:hypothetical protein
MVHQFQRKKKNKIVTSVQPMEADQPKEPKEAD